LNNARYISKMAMKLLSNIVREESEDSFLSKNVLPVTGSVTAKLKQHWQLNDAWNELIQPRFKRLNEITKSNLFGDYEERNGHKIFINRVPEELQKDFDKKRIDHRHHAMDALVIALADYHHLNYLNNISGQDKKEQKLKERFDIKAKYMTSKKDENGDKARFFLPPAQMKLNGTIVEYLYNYNGNETKLFKDAALEALKNTIVSFKQKNRIIRQRTNEFQKWNNETGKLKLIMQENLNEKHNFNVRQPLHKATYYGKVKLQHHVKEVPLSEAILEFENIVDPSLRKVISDYKNNTKLTNEEITNFLIKDSPKVKIYENYVATRYENYLESFAGIEPEKIISAIQSVTDTGIQKILRNHLQKYNSISRKIQEISKNVDTIVNEEHREVIKELLRDNVSVEEIEIDKKKISETEVFTNGLIITEEEQTRILLNPQIAFSPEGIKELNKNIKELNGGKNHKPIYKARLKDALGTKFPLSEMGQKSSKIVVTAAGSNAYCGVYENHNKERMFYIPTLRETVENLKQGNPPCPSIYHNDKNGEFKLIFVLSPNDLVYVPTEEETLSPSLINFNNLNQEQKNRIYKFRDGSINEKGVVQINFIPSNWSAMIFKKTKGSKKIVLENGKELAGEITLTTDKDKSQNSLDGIQIRNVCWKLEINRLGLIRTANFPIIKTQKELTIGDKRILLSFPVDIAEKFEKQYLLFSEIDKKIIAYEFLKNIQGEILSSSLRNDIKEFVSTNLKFMVR
jgi:CRISPR-associated endonuclease Csn1